MRVVTVFYYMMFEIEVVRMDVMFIITNLHGYNVSL